MPDPDEKPGPRKRDLVRRLARPAVALAGVIVFQLLFARVFAGVLTKEFTAAAAAVKTPLRVRDLVPLLASDSAGGSLFFLVIAWTLGGYVAATAVGVLAGMGGPGPRQAAIRLGVLAGYPASRAPQRAAQVAGAAAAASLAS